MKLEGLEELENKYKEMWEEIEKLKKKEEKIDFSKFVGRCAKHLAIKWKKLLKSYIEEDFNNEVGIGYDDFWSVWYVDSLNYEHTTLSELKYWDVFILEKHVEYAITNNFKIFNWIDDDWDYANYSLENDSGMEHLGFSCYCWWNLKVIKFLRK